MRKALVVGINHYTFVSPLFGCVDDARGVERALERHGDGRVNFGVKLLIGTGPAHPVPRSTLREQIQELFAGDSEIALLYFAGHGHIEATGGYLLASDARSGDEGVALSDVLTWANRSTAQNKLVVLDSCHSGIAGTPSSSSSTAIAELTEGLTILTASTAEQYATEKDGKGVFTTLFLDALNGGAANLVGAVTPGGVYAHIDQSLGPWDQRPVFKTNVRSFISLRTVQPPLSLTELRRITELFPTPGFEFGLDPSFEPERGAPQAATVPPDPAHAEQFAVLQKYSRVNLVVPVNAPHMWHAAMEGRSCRLTVLGEHYRRLVELGRI
jgi:hypothetical protein